MEFQKMQYNLQFQKAEEAGLGRDELQRRAWETFGGDENIYILIAMFVSWYMDMPKLNNFIYLKFMQFIVHQLYFSKTKHGKVTMYINFKSERFERSTKNVKLLIFWCIFIYKKNFFPMFPRLYMHQFAVATVTKCHNLGGFETIEIYYLMVLEGRSLKLVALDQTSWCWQTRLPEGCRGLYVS